MFEGTLLTFVFEGTLLTFVFEGTLLIFVFEGTLLTVVLHFGVNLRNLKVFAKLIEKFLIRKTSY